MHAHIIGDSHLTALKQAHNRAPSGTHRIRFGALGPAMELLDAFWTDGGDHLVVTVKNPKNPKITLPDPQRPDLALGLAMALWPTRLVRSLLVENLTLAAIHDPAKAPEARPISTGLFHRLVIDDMQHSLSLAEAAQRLGLRPFAVDAPGLFRAHPMFSARPDFWVLGLRAAYLSVARAELTKRGVAIVDTPAECFNPDGTMRDIYRHADPNDTHHANIEFGALMMARVDAHLNGLAKAAPTAA